MLKQNWQLLHTEDWSEEEHFFHTYLLSNTTRLWRCYCVEVVVSSAERSAEVTTSKFLEWNKSLNLVFVKIVQHTSNHLINKNRVLANQRRCRTPTSSNTSLLVTQVKTKSLNNLTKAVLELCLLTKKPVCYKNTCLTFSTLRWAYFLAKLHFCRKGPRFCVKSRQV